MIFLECIGSRACLSAKQHWKQMFWELNTRFYVQGCKVGCYCFYRRSDSSAAAGEPLYLLLRGWKL